MNAIKGVVKNGRVEVDTPADWPEGSIVQVELGVNGAASCDAERDLTAEEIEEKIRRLDALGPVMTEEEEAAWQAERRANRDLAIASRPAYDQRLEELFP